jgi:hypothetical protein
MWIKQNHTVAGLKQEVSLLNDKVKRLESELEKNKNSLSGGVKIPIQFAHIQKKNSIDFEQNNENTIRINNDIESSVESSVESSIETPKENAKDILTSDSKVSSKVSSKQSKKSSQKVLEIDNLSDINQTELDNISLSDLKNEESIVQATEIILESNTENSKKSKKKSSIPDPKSYNNGDKITDDNNVEYLCVVGKRGGHSWKKLN